MQTTYFSFISIVSRVISLGVTPGQDLNFSLRIKFVTKSSFYHLKKDFENKKGSPTQDVDRCVLTPGQPTAVSS